MKKTAILITAGIAFICNTAIYSQGFTAGVNSGVNISDIHGNEPYGKWRFMTGPVQGAFVDYNLTKSIGFSTGIKYMTLYYEQRNYFTSDYYPVFSSSSYSYLLPDIWQPYQMKMDFSMLTVPLQAKLTIPSKPDFYLAAGTFWSFMTDKPRNLDTKRDFGYIYSAGISTPLGDVFKGSFNLGYATGRKEFQSWRHGSYEITLGISYTGFLKGRPSEKRDSSARAMNLLYFGGMNYSWNGKGEYGAKSGVSAGFRIDIPIGSKVAFRTGLSFEQGGYSLQDSSDRYYAIYTVDDASYYADTRIITDYLFIPATLKFGIGRRNLFYFNIGPYAALKLNARVSGEAISVESHGSYYTRTKINVYDDIEPVFTDTDLGFLAGAGINLPFFGRCRSEAGIQYKAGMDDVFDTKAANLPYSEVRVFNRALSFHLGIIVPVQR